MRLELHAGGHFNTSPLFSDSKSWGFSAYRVRLAKSFGAEGSERCVCACTIFLLCSSEVKRGCFCQKLITRKHHYVNSCGEKRERTMDGDKHKPRKSKIDCVYEVSDGW